MRRCTLNDTPSNYRRILEFMIDKNPDLLGHIVNKRQCSVIIKLDDLDRINPKCRKIASKYNPLVNYMRSIGVNLQIVSKEFDLNNLVII